MNEEIKWFAAYTAVGAEAAVSAKLRKMGHSSLCLHERVKKRMGGKTFSALAPLFPRYVFAGVERVEDLGDIGRMPGVQWLVKVGERPIRIASGVIRRLAERGDKDGVVSVTADERAKRESLRAGDVVRISSGPFVGMGAEVAVVRGESVVVSLEMFRGAVRATMPQDALSQEVRGDELSKATG